jgi:hypothetical protein
MEKNVANNLVNCIARISVSQESSLYTIRHWKNLSVAFDGDTIWIKDFSNDQAFSPYLKKIPFIDLYEQKDGLLFKKDKLVPERKIPQGLLWNPVQRAFPVSIGELNHNYFGIDYKIQVRIVPSAAEQSATALLTEMHTAKNYITEAAAVRLQHLSWCMLSDKAFFEGAPLLGIAGAAYWHNNGNFIPGGYDFEFPLLGNIIYQRLVPNGEHKIIWFTDSSYLLLPFKYLVPLSVSSIRLSIQ